MMSFATHIAAALMAAVIAWKVESWHCGSNNGDLRVAVTRQNASVEAMRARTKAAQAAIIHIQPEVNALHKGAADLLATKQKGDACTAADRLIMESVR